MRTLQSIEDILKKPYFLFYSILLFFTPLIFSQNTNELFEFPKMLFVYLFGFFIIFFFISDIVLNPVGLKKPHPLAITLFLLTSISTTFSSHFYTSFFGYYSRFNDAFLSYIVFFGLYFVAINKLKKEDFEKIIKVSLFTILPISIYGLSQYLNGVSRAYSSLGQPNWLSQYLGMLLPILIYYVIKENPKNFKIWFVIYAFGFFCFWVTFSMSGIISFLIGAAILFWKIISKEKKSKDFNNRVIVLVALTFLIAVSNLGIYKHKISDIFSDLKKQAVTVGRVYAQEDENKISDPGFIRLELWKSTLSLIFSSPKIFFLGSGPETFPYAFQPFRNGRLNYSSEWDFVFNKPHNYYLELWSESGIFSLLVFISLLYVATKKSSKYLVPSILVFAVSNIFGWPVVPTSLLFWFFLGTLDDAFDGKLISSVAGTKKKADKNKVREVILLIPLWVFYIFIVSKMFSFYNADINYKKSQELIKNAYNDDEALFYADKSILQNPFEPNYYRGRAKVRTVSLLISQDTGYVKNEMYKDLKKAEELNENNLVTTRNSIPLYYFLAVDDVYKGSGEENLDERYATQAIEFFEKTKKRYSNDVGVILAVAKYEKKLGLSENYNESVSRIEKLRPELPEWHELFR